MSLATFDFILLAIAAFFAILSLRHGILYEIASIASWILAFFISSSSYLLFSDTLSSILANLFTSLDTNIIVAISPTLSFIIIVLFAFLVIAFFLRRILTFPTKNSHFKFFERIFGGLILGAAKTYLLAAIFLGVYQYAAPLINLDIEPPFLVDSFSYYYIESLTIILVDFFSPYI